jgi:hypothetical protein
MDTVLDGLFWSAILRREPHIPSAFWLFLVSKSDGSARPVLDLSPFTPFYVTPPVRLYSAAEVVAAIPPDAKLIKLGFSSGFFQSASGTSINDIAEFITEGNASHGPVFQWAIP